MLTEFGGIAKNSLLNIIESESDNYGINQPSSYLEISALIPTLQKNEGNFRILSLNIQSLNAKFDHLKIPISGLNECGCNISGVCLQETWLSDIDDISLFHLEGYTLISQHKVSSKYGGVAIYLSESYDYKLLPLYPNINIWDGQFIEIQTPSAHKNIIVGNIYRPPQDININYDTFIRELQPIIQELNKRKCEVILSGDYNIDLLKINEKPKFNEFLDTLCSYNFLPKITLPTRLGVTSATLIDNFFSNLFMECLHRPYTSLHHKFPTIYRIE